MRQGDFRETEEIKMAAGLANGWFLFLYLLLSMGSYGNGIRQLTELNMHGHMSPHMHEHMSPHMKDIDASKGAFFSMSDLYVGHIMPIPVEFLNRNISSSPHLLPREEADSIPFSYTQLPNLLRFFSFPTGSPQAKVMETTLSICEAMPDNGETKTCATSLESMLDFVRGVFVPEDITALTTTTHFPNLYTHPQNFTIVEVPRERKTTNMVGCHIVEYPYAIYYCHTQDSEVKVFEVSLGREEDGSRVEAVAACHMDTSHWSPDHVSFHLLNFKPGEFPVCHFFPTGHLVWVSSPAAKSHLLN